MWKSIPDCTLTTCLYDLSQIHPLARSCETGIKNIDELLKTPCYLVIYGDRITIPLVRQIRKEYSLEELTVFKEVEIQNWWTYPWIETIRKNREIFWATRDDRTCPESHALVCNKFDFVLQTISENPFGTSKFGWIDAQPQRMCEDYSPEKLLNVLENLSEKFQIQILNVVNKSYKLPQFKKEYYSSYPWLVCGGFFTCGKDIGIKVLDRLKEIFVQTTVSGYGHGEEGFYLEPLDEFYDEIEKSYGDYGQMINNFSGACKNINYIYHVILQRYLIFGYYREAADCASHLIRQFHKRAYWVSMDMILNIYRDYYQSLMKIDKTKASEVHDEIRFLLQENPVFRKTYELQEHKWI